MQRTYFVSYARIPRHTAGLGFSHMTMTQSGPMTAESFVSLVALLRDQNPGYDCIVLSFQELATAEQTSSV